MLYKQLSITAVFRRLSDLARLQTKGSIILMFSCGSLGQTTSAKSGVTCSSVFLISLLCGRKNLCERRHSRLYQLPHLHPLPSRSLTPSRSLSLCPVPNHCLYSCLSPLQHKPLSGGISSHTNIHTFFPGSDRVQKVIILICCRIFFGGKVISS